ncbi:MAG: hypothetical protein ABIS23_00020 [Sphingomicrobium sp.]
MRTLLAAILIILGTPISAQQPARPDHSRFHAFAKPLVGEWTVTIRERDEIGKMLFEERQKQVFAMTVANEFLEWHVISGSGSASRETGVVLFSYKPRENRLLQHAFFPGHADLRFTADLDLTRDNRGADGVIITPAEPGFRQRRRLEIRWVGPSEFHYRCFARDANGREFLNEELVYQRIA